MPHVTPSAQSSNPGFTRLRVASWNIRKALGTDRKRDPERILDILGDIQADVVLLQEADFRLPPRRPIFAVEDIARRAGLKPVMLSHGRDSLGWHGNVILTHPSILHSRMAYHDLPGLEPRGAIEAALEKDGIPFRAIGVHLGLLRGSRRLQLSALLKVLGDGSPCLIAGDFNERSEREGLGRLSRRFRILAGGPTYHARLPIFALDRIAISASFEAETLQVLRTAETSRASDHLPLIANLRLSAPHAVARAENA